MPHNYKLAQELNNKTNYIDWCKELEVWLELTELEEEKKALAIFSSLTGNITDIKSITTEHPKTSHKLSKTIRQDKKFPK